ncbi:MAG: nicotinate-nucleotide adenylyltransferase [Desulfuromonadia bacterium]
MRLGILGGTFNPIHYGHLRIAEEARDSLSLDRVIFIPALTPPHKRVEYDVPFEDRYTMTQRGIAGNPSFVATSMERDLSPPSYSYNTLSRLRGEYPDASLFFIIGSDTFRELDLWHRYRELFLLTNFIVISRPGYPLDDLVGGIPRGMEGEFDPIDRRMLRHTAGSLVHGVEGCGLDISSSRLRSMVRRGESLRYLTPDGVIDYIAEKGIYR